jgi:hypothetical protein
MQDWDRFQGCRFRKRVGLHIQEVATNLLNTQQQQQQQPTTENENNSAPL